VNPKDRIRNTVLRRPVDRVPVDFTAVDEVRQRLRRHFSSSTDEAFLVAFQVDMIWITEPEYLKPTMETENHREDYWGVRRRKKSYGEGVYWEPCDYPLKSAEKPEDLDEHPWPDPDDFNYDGYLAKLKAQQNYATCGGLGSAFYVPTLLRDMSLVLMDMMLNPPILDALVGRVVDFQLEYYERIFRKCRGYLDVFYIADDYGTQTGLMFDKDIWRRFFRNGISRLVNLAHRYDLLVMLHSCGSVRELIGDFIDIGVDILDPIQTTAAHMDIAELKADFGQHICFHGAIDTQKLLNFGTVGQVRDHVRQTIEVLGNGGGYIIAPCHNIQVSTPVENILALYETANKYR
jgi:uroporphyrinogen decarboxylase